MSKALISYSDLEKIICGAKDSISKMSLPLNISNKEVEQKYVSNVAVIESTIIHLNSKGLLNNLIKFDYTDLSAAYEVDMPELEPRKPQE